MFKLISTALLAAAFSITFSGCADKDPERITKTAECTIDNVEAPSWACGSTTLEGSVTAVGSASSSSRGQGFSRKEAMTDSRFKLAKKIQTFVKNEVNTFARSTEVRHVATADKVAKQVAKMTYDNSKQMRYWQNSASKEIYVLVGITQNEINQAIKDAVRPSYQNDNVLKKLDEAFPTY
ncbi:MAG: hypothetical protein DRG24_08340 [Epsilonproteobacteria bacterium]|nr:MAG: hypothetical protein DRG24_08340 [Campylobacterota bacterium]